MARRLILIRRIGLSLLVPYIYLVIVATIIARIPAEESNIILIPFSTYREALINDFWEFEIKANILLFIPVGLFLSMILNHSKYLPLFFGTMVSVIIEIVQLVTRRGTFEFDDLISNFFGVLIGCIIYLPFRMLAEIDVINEEL